MKRSTASPRSQSASAAEGVLTVAGADADGVTGPAEPLFIDTWAWLVLAKVRDPAHATLVRFRETYSRAKWPWITTDYVLDEMITRLFATTTLRDAETFTTAILHAGNAGSLIIERITAHRFTQAYQMRLRYRDKPRISFTDFTSFVVMKELRLRTVLTADAHFLQAGLGFRLLP